MSKQFPKRMTMMTGDQLKNISMAESGSELHFHASDYPRGEEYISITEHAHLMEEKQKRIERLEAALSRISNGPEIIYFKENGAMSGKPIEAKEIAREALAAEGKE